MEVWVGKFGEDRNGLYSGKLEKRLDDVFQVYLNLYENNKYNALKSSLLCDLDFTNKRLLLRQFEV